MSTQSEISAFCNITTTISWSSWLNLEVLSPSAVASSNSSPVSYWATWQTNRELYTRTCQTVFTIFCFQKMFKITKLVPQCFMLPIHLLVVFCVLKFYFVDFYGMFTSSPTWRLKMHVLCKVGKKIIFQNKTLLVHLFYTHYKTFWYQFCNFKHFLKAENSEDGLASSCVEFSQYETTYYWNSSNSNPVSQSHTGLHDRPVESSTHKLAKLSSLFSAFRKCFKLQNWYQNVLCCL